LELEVTVKVAEELEDLLCGFKKKEQNQTIEKSDASQITKVIDKLDPTLDAEMQLKKAFIVVARRQSIENLLNNPENLFAKDVYSSLSTIARYDFQEGFKCLAFSRATASAFHCLRATEEMLKQLYFHYVKQKRIPNPMWNQMVLALKSKKKEEDSQRAAQPFRYDKI